jgi:hypothetical protein
MVNMDKDKDKKVKNPFGKIPKNLDNFHPETPMGKRAKEMLSDPEVYRLMLRLRDM